jgi:hypothetical protein
LYSTVKVGIKGKITELEKYPLTQKSASYRDLHLEIDNEGTLKTKLNNNNSINISKIYNHLSPQNN